MATRFNIAGSTLLSDKAEQLNPSSELPAHVALAADLLDIAGLHLSDATTKKAERALAVQVNFQVEAGVDAAVYSSRSRAERSDDYTASSSDSFTGIDPRAERLAASIRREATEAEEAKPWTTVRSLR